MRKKWLRVLALSIAVIGLSLLMQAVASPAQERVYQHQQSAQAAYCLPEDTTVFCSHLPVVTLETEGQEIGQLAEITGAMSIIDNRQGHNHLDGSPTLSSSIRIKTRGNSSSRFDKKQYRVTFVSDDDPLVSVDHAVMGMPAESDWVLNGPYLDKTLLRNYLMYNIAGEIMDWAPNVRFCEVFLNGTYQGVYLMVEAVKVGEHRVNVTKVVEGQAATGYLVARERPGDTNYALDTFGTYAAKTYNELGIAYPSQRVLTELQAEYVRQDISAFEKMLYSLDYDDPRKGYASWIDVQSFVDYFLLNEFSLNSDAGALSTYAHKDIRSKLKMGPVWDFNNGFDNYQYYAKDLQSFHMTNTNWYVMLLRDELFVESIIKRYRELREGVLNEARVMQLIDDTIAWLGPAIDRNFEVWGYTFDMNLLDSDDSEVERDLRSYEEAVAQLKYVILARGQFLDESIESLRHFSAESAVKEWN